MRKRRVITRSAQAAQATPTPIEHHTEQSIEHPIEQPIEQPVVLLHSQGKQHQQAPSMNPSTEETPHIPIKIIIPSSVKETSKPIITIRTSSLPTKPVSETIQSSTPSKQPILPILSPSLSSSPTPVSSPVSTSSQLNLPPLTPLPSPFPHKFELYQAIQNNTLNSYQYYRSSLSPDDHRICLLQSPLTHGLINRTTPFILFFFFLYIVSPYHISLIKIVSNQVVIS